MLLVAFVSTRPGLFGKHPNELIRGLSVPMNFGIVDAIEAGFVNNWPAQASLQILPKTIHRCIPGGNFRDSNVFGVFQ
jgi:hypothetical protein